MTTTTVTMLPINAMMFGPPERESELLWGTV